MTPITTSTLRDLSLDSQVVTSVDINLSDYVETSELSDYVIKNRTDISSDMTIGEIFKVLATDLGHNWVEVIKSTED